MSAIDDMTGLIGITMAAGVVQKVTNSMFPTPQQPQAPVRRTRKAKKATRNNHNHPGNFSNVLPRR